ncbi:galactofuranose ABC transporter, permease protein YjfF [Pseudonocardia sp. ICBG1142]|uniref:galactofuranose ABC transporter, permease protein YjfF n=1 Tax=Pseudonocardia sp. ICBG1142 TaxID=2846760 RepID=UPI001CF62E3A|nr:galactofuranose ABC transporter, permease protein YjfF [Pseudonocardia sp. ICBG1142]
MTTTTPRPTRRVSAGSLLSRLPRPSTQVLPVLATFVLFVLLFGAGSVRYDNFLSPQVFLNLFVDNAYLIVLAVGMTFVILTGGIDLSVGSVVALSGVLAATLLADGWPALPVMAAVLVVGVALGTAMGLVIHHLEIQPFVVTLAGMFLARGLCYVISVESVPVTDPTFTAIAQAAIPLGGRSFVSPSVVVALVVVAVAAWVLHRTRFGRTVYAVGGNRHSAMLMGLAVGRTRVAVYAISGFCSALAGLLFTFYSLSGYSLAAVGTELDAIAATVIGGTLLSGGVGLVVGSLLGVLVLGLIQTFISFEGTLSSWWTRIVVGALLLVFVLLQRAFARRGAGGS